MKSNNQFKSDGFSYWNSKIPPSNYDIGIVDDEERSISQSVSLLLKNKNIGQRKFVQLPSHLITSNNCGCHHMINKHPAPHIHDRDTSRRVSTPYQKYRPRHLEDNNQDSVFTSRSEPVHVPHNASETQSLDKKLRTPIKIPPRTVSLNIPAHPRSFQSTLKYSTSTRISNPVPVIEELQIQASSIFDQSPTTSQFFLPRGPPPSPKTPTQETSTLFFNLIPPAPLRAVPLTPCLRNSNENIKRVTYPNTIKIPTATPREETVRDYLSASDCSDDDDKDDDDNNDDDHDDKNTDLVKPKTKPKASLRTKSLSRTSGRSRDRWISHNANRYLSLAEVYYSSLDIHKNISERSHRRLRAQTRTRMSNTDNDDSSTTLSKATSKTVSLPQSKSGFGFCKTASSMHFGYAAGRLCLRESFEKWPQPLSQRTPIARKQEVTALRLVTLPLVTS